MKSISPLQFSLFLESWCAKFQLLNRPHTFWNYFLTMNASLRNINTFSSKTILWFLQRKHIYSSSVTSLNNHVRIKFNITVIICFLKKYGTYSCTLTHSLHTRIPLEDHVPENSWTAWGFSKHLLCYYDFPFLLNVIYHSRQI